MPCEKNSRKLCEDDECEICFNKSFASHPKSSYWSEENIISAREVFKNTGTKYKFNCDCGHGFEKAPHYINVGRWCPYESNQKLCSDDDCDQCYHKSFASHPKVFFWSDDNEINPINIFKSSGKKYKFDCECGHQFEKALNYINAGDWCTYCCEPPIKLCHDENCVQCFNKSFASHPNSFFWSFDNKIKPRNVFKSSGIKYLFECENDHQFEIRPGDIVSGYWCPRCYNKTEGKVYDYLTEKGYNFTPQPKYEWCKRNDIYHSISPLKNIKLSSKLTVCNISAKFPTGTLLRKIKKMTCSK